MAYVFLVIPRQRVLVATTARRSDCAYAPQMVPSKASVGLEWHAGVQCAVPTRVLGVTTIKYGVYHSHTGVRREFPRMETGQAGFRARSGAEAKPQEAAELARAFPIGRAERIDSFLDRRESYTWILRIILMPLNGTFLLLTGLIPLIRSLTIKVICLSGGSTNCLLQGHPFQPFRLVLDCLRNARERS